MQEQTIPRYAIEMHEELKRRRAILPTAEERIADLEERLVTLERIVLSGGIEDSILRAVRSAMVRGFNRI